MTLAVGEIPNHLAAAIKALKLALISIGNRVSRLPRHVKKALGTLATVRHKI